jgi:mono/diheme cytochrome c family protein
VSRAAITLAVGVCLLHAGCEAAPTAGDLKPMRLGGVEVSGRVLARGETVYRQRCMVCHGETGDGQGPSGRHLKPPPRDLRKGEYKFAPDPKALPDDAYFHRILTEGIPNTMMQPWGLGHDDRHAVIQYVKTLSPRWLQEPTR